MQNWYSCLLSSSRWWVSILSIIIYGKKISQIWRCNRNIHVHLTFFFVASWNEIASTFFMFRWSVCTRWGQTTLTRPSTSLTASSSSAPYLRSFPSLSKLSLRQRNSPYVGFCPTIIVTEMFSGVLGELHPSRWLLWSLRPSSTSPS